MFGVQAASPRRAVSAAWLFAHMGKACAISQPALLIQIKELAESPGNPAIPANTQIGPTCNQQLRNKISTHMKFARFSIFTAMDRNTAISQVCDAVSEASGWIVEQSFFSNIAATINFEMSSNSLRKFQQALQEKGFKVHVEGELPAAVSADVRGTVSLTFSHSEPDLRRDVPPFG